MKKILLVWGLLLTCIVFAQSSEPYKKMGSFGSEWPFGLAVTMGLVDNVSPLDKFGLNPTVAPNTDPEDIWQFGGVYIWDEGADVTKVSSSNATDVGDTILVDGLDLNGYRVEQLVILNGQTPVTLDSALWRVYRAYTYGMDRVEGEVFVFKDGNVTNGVPDDNLVRAYIDPETQQTLQALYTVPRGKVGFLFRGELGVELEGNTGSLAEYAHCHYESRRYGKVFRVKKALTLMIGGSSTYQDVRSFPDIIPALTDIRLRIQAVTQAMGAWGTLVTFYWLTSQDSQTNTLTQSDNHDRRNILKWN